MLRNFFAREDRSVEGQTMVEYALILFLVSIAAIVALRAMGPLVSAVFASVNTQLTP